MRLYEEKISLRERGDCLRLLRQLQQNIEQMIDGSRWISFFQLIGFSTLDPNIN